MIIVEGNAVESAGDYHLVADFIFFYIEKDTLFADHVLLLSKHFAFCHEIFYIVVA